MSKKKDQVPPMTSQEIDMLSKIILANEKFRKVHDVIVDLEAHDGKYTDVSPSWLVEKVIKPSKAVTDEKHSKGEAVKKRLNKYLMHLKEDGPLRQNLEKLFSEYETAGEKHSKTQLKQQEVSVIDKSCEMVLRERAERYPTNGVSFKLFKSLNKEEYEATGASLGSILEDLAKSSGQTIECLLPNSKDDKMTRIKHIIIPENEEQDPKDDFEPLGDWYLNNVILSKTQEEAGTGKQRVPSIITIDEQKVTFRKSRKEKESDPMQDDQPKKSLTTGAKECQNLTEAGPKKPTTVFENTIFVTLKRGLVVHITNMCAVNSAINIFLTESEGNPNFYPSLANALQHSPLMANLVVAARGKHYITRWMEVLQAEIGIFIIRSANKPGSIVNDTPQLFEANAIGLDPLYVLALLGITTVERTFQFGASLASPECHPASVSRRRLGLSYQQFLRMQQTGETKVLSRNCRCQAELEIHDHADDLFLVIANEMQLVDHLTIEKLFPRQTSFGSKMVQLKGILLEFCLFGETMHALTIQPKANDDPKKMLQYTIIDDNSYFPPKWEPVNAKFTGWALCALYVQKQ